jgi:AMIN domain
VRRILIGALVLYGGLLSAQAGVQAASVRHVSVLKAGDHVEVEITSSAPLTPQTLVVANPDRLVVDFPGAVPGDQLRDLAVNRDQVKGIRVGLFASNPPVTRVVLDLKSPQPYQVFPSGRSVIIKVGGGAAPSTGLPTVASLMSPVTPTPPPISRPVSRVQVEFLNGKLSIKADKATLAQVLFQVHQQTGADIAIPPAASQEQVVTNIGPAPVRDAMAALLYGSPYDFVLVGSDRNPGQLSSVLLTPRGNSSGAAFPASSGPPGADNSVGLPPEPDPVPQPFIPPEPPQNDDSQPPPDIQPVPAEPPQ